MAKKQYKVVISQKGQDAFIKQITFKAAQDRQQARNLKAKVINALRSLETLPRRAPFLWDEDIPLKKYRKLLVDNRYLIIYQIIEQTVYVELVVDCKQDFHWLIRK